jgi:GT2 family glycosyltransferase/glycosyltransferase involved in cell wall biosynthesis
VIDEHRLGIVVVNFGSHQLLEENLAALDTRALDAEVIVVDNWSGRTERDAVTAVAASHAWTCVTTAANLGFGAGMNRGVAAALERGCSHVLILNPDVRIDGSAVRRLWQVGIDRPGVVVCPTLQRPDGSTWFSGATIDLDTGVVRPGDEGGARVAWLTGACLLVDRLTWDRVGGFDERYFLYWEDVDLSRRCAEVGIGLAVAPEVVAVHDVGGTQGTTGKSPTYCYYMCRNRLRFASDHLGRRRQLRWLAGAAAYAADVVLRSGRRAVLRQPSLSIAAARGTLAGALGMLRALVGERTAAPRSGSSDTSDPELVVLESVDPPHSMTNPYITQLIDSLPPDVHPRFFSWRTALLGKYDVLHVHWPDAYLYGRDPARTALRAALFLAMLLRIRLTGRAVVRTIHNVVPHEAVSWWRAPLLRLCDRWTTVWITLTDHVHPPDDEPTVLIPHGHYRNWFARRQHSTTVRGRLAFVGLIRRYKGVDTLVRAFTATSDPALELHVVGRVDDADTGRVLADAAAADPRLTVLDTYVSDDELVRQLTEAELVVLPFRTSTNSGSVLLALSLDRPVLVPRTDVVAELAAEVGDGWVLSYDGELDATTLTDALDHVREHPLRSRPDLSRRDWDELGRRHEEAFRVAVALRRHRT